MNVSSVRLDKPGTEQRMEEKLNAGIFKIFKALDGLEFQMIPGRHFSYHLVKAILTDKQ